MIPVKLTELFKQTCPWYIDLLNKTIKSIIDYDNLVDAVQDMSYEDFYIRMCNELYTELCLQNRCKFMNLSDANVIELAITEELDELKFRISDGKLYLRFIFNFKSKTLTYIPGVDRFW